MASCEGDIESSQNKVQIFSVSALEVNEVDSSFVRPSFSFHHSSLFWFNFELFSVFKVLNVSSFWLKIHESLASFNGDELSV